jgi:gamma-glutamyltranspeptidase
MFDRGGYVVDAGVAAGFALAVLKLNENSLAANARF